MTQLKKTAQKDVQKEVDVNPNMNIYNQVRVVPESAKREIKAGKLIGKTDINPQWRIETLTKLFGPCGIGWNIKVTNQWTEQGANGEVLAFTNVELTYRLNGEWSQPVCGTGGNVLILKTNTKGLQSDDEAFKKSETDAISVACKKMGIGADVYWSEGSTKYTNGDANVPESPENDYPAEQPVEDMQLAGAIQEIQQAKSRETLQTIYNTYSMYANKNTQFMDALNKRNTQLYKSEKK